MFKTIITLTLSLSFLSASAMASSASHSEILRSEISNEVLAQNIEAALSLIALNKMKAPEAQSYIASIIKHSSTQDISDLDAVVALANSMAMDVAAK